jgi:hypothetical protein
VPEIDEQAQILSCGGQIVPHLRLVCAAKPGGGLDLEDDMAVAHEVGPVARSDGASLVEQWHRNFARVGDLAVGQLHLKRVAVGGFEQSGPEFPLDVDGGTQDGVDLGRR